MKIIDIINGAWAIMPGMLDEIWMIYDRWAVGETVDIEAIGAALGKPLKNEQARYEVTPEGVAVIPVRGVIGKRMNMLSEISGGASTELIGADFREALGRADVKAILLDVDSPGGSVDGVPELAAEMFAARGVKPMASWGDGTMASAAMWLGASADEVYLSGSSGMAGSIGVLMKHRDISKAEEMAGRKTTVLTAGKYKALGNQYEPLSKEGREYVQGQLDYFYTMFVENMADFRGAAVEDVLENMADGKIFYGSQAVQAGLVDGIMSRSAVMKRLMERMGDGKEMERMRKKNMGSMMGSRNGASAQKPGNVAQKEGGVKVDMETLRAQHPDLVTALLNEGKALGITEGKNLGITEGKAAGVIEGAAAERDRIQAVRAQSMPGHEALIEALANDGKTTGPEAAVLVLAAEKKKLGTNLGRIEGEAPKPANASLGAEAIDAEKEKEAKAEGEPKWKAEFEKSEELQAQYGGRVESYVAYKKAVASGKVRELGK